MELRSKVEDAIAQNQPDGILLKYLAALLDVYNICEATKPLTERIARYPIFHKDYSNRSDIIGELMRKRASDYYHLVDPIMTLQNTTQSCEEMVLFCIWLDRVENCTDLFQEIETDYGYCCTFNTIPLSLLMKYNDDPRDDPERVEGWKKEDIHYDNVMFDEKTMNRKYPLRQLYPGRSAGLSILLNPELHEYYCTNTDSDGFVAALNVPLDFPRMKDNGIAIRTNSEVFISVRPEITMPDESLRQFPLEKRGCYFSDERELRHYSRYTTSNCMNECITRRTRVKCGCIRYYMPSGAGDENEKLCSPEVYNCTADVRANIRRSGVEDSCLHCLPTCTEIEYQTEATTLGIRDEQVTNLFSQLPNMPGVNNVSILHVYFNVDSTYPRLRTEATTVIGLISNAGGLLGLCLGLSMLSILEIVYHATLRLCCNFYRNRQMNGKSIKHGKNNLDDVNSVTAVTNYTSSSPVKRSNGFVSKIFHVGTLVDETERRRNATNSRAQGKKPRDIPHYFQTSFGTGFQRASLKGAWLPQEGIMEDTGGTLD